jgi:hypothetical protein
MRTTTPHTSHDRDHDDISPSNHKCVSCYSYHLRAVVLTMSKSVVATMIPMMGGHEDNNNQGKAHRDHGIINTSN